MIRLASGDVVSPLALFANFRDRGFDEQSLFVRKVNRRLGHSLSFFGFLHFVPGDERLAVLILRTIDRRGAAAVEPGSVGSYGEMIGVFVHALPSATAGCSSKFACSDS